MLSAKKWNWCVDTSGRSFHHPDVLNPLLSPSNRNISVWNCIKPCGIWAGGLRSNLLHAATTSNVGSLRICLHSPKWWSVIFVRLAKWRRNSFVVMLWIQLFRGIWHEIDRNKTMHRCVLATRKYFLVSLETERDSFKTAFSSYTQVITWIAFGNPQ